MLQWYLIVWIDPEGGNQALAYAEGATPAAAKQNYKKNTGDYRTGLIAVIWQFLRGEDVHSYPAQ